MTDIVSIQEAAQSSGWSITAFDLPEVWLKTQGEGVKIAVLDSQVQLDHPDLVDNLLPGVSLLPNMAPHNHATHVAGIIAAVNNAIGMVGVAPKAKVIPITVLDSGGNGTLKVVAQGIREALSRGADIITMSLGSPRPLPYLQESIRFAADKGIPIFVAAGNAGKTPDVYYPAAYAETVAVGAIDRDFRRASFSNTGKNLDFMAPGVEILSTVPVNWYAMLSGSSMATPFLAGIAALLLSYSRAHGHPRLASVEDYREEFRKRAFPIKGEGASDDFFEGFGVVSVKDLFNG